MSAETPVRPHQPGGHTHTAEPAQTVEPREREELSRTPIHRAAVHRRRRQHPVATTAAVYIYGAPAASNGGKQVLSDAGGGGAAQRLLPVVAASGTSNCLRALPCRRRTLPACSFLSNFSPLLSFLYIFFRLLLFLILSVMFFPSLSTSMSRSFFYYFAPHFKVFLSLPPSPSHFSLFFSVTTHLL